MNSLASHKANSSQPGLTLRIRFDRGEINITKTLKGARARDFLKESIEVAEKVNAATKPERKEFLKTLGSVELWAKNAEGNYAKVLGEALPISQNFNDEFSLFGNATDIQAAVYKDEHGTPGKVTISHLFGHFLCGLVQNIQFLVFARAFDSGKAAKIGAAKENFADSTALVREFFRLVDSLKKDSLVEMKLLLEEVHFEDALKKIRELTSR